MIAKLIVIATMIFGFSHTAPQQKTQAKGIWWDRYHDAIAVEDRGWLSKYDQLPTDATMEYRMDIGEITVNPHKYDVWVAVLSCDRIGQTGTLLTRSGEFKALVFDCAGDDGGHRWMIHYQILAEVDYYFAQEYPGLINSWAMIEYD